MKKKLCFSSLEILEDRIAPAGVVTVLQSSPGEFTLTGDGMDNQVSIFETVPGSFRIEGLTGTTLNPGGVATMDITALTRLTIIGNDGSDTINIANVTTLNSLFIDGGNGSDSFNGINLAVAGKVEFSGGDGSDAFTFDGRTTNIGGDLRLSDTLAGITASLNAEHTVIGGSLIVVGGTGTEFLFASGTGALSIGKGINFDAGTAGFGQIGLGYQGSHTIGALATGESVLFKSNADGSSINFSNGATILAGGVRVMGGALNDSISFNSPSRDVRIGTLATGQSILFDGGAGSDSISLSGATVSTGGGIEFNGGDGNGNIALTSPNGRISLGKISSGQSIKFTGGANADSISTDASVLNFSGGIEFTAGDGTNSISLNSPSGKATIGKSAGASIKYTGGNGDDSISAMSAKLVLLGGLDFSSGDGANSITLNSPNGKVSMGKLQGGASLRYVGGSGTDGITATNALLNLGGGIDFTGGPGVTTINLSGPNGRLLVGALGTGQSVKFAGGADADSFTTNFAAAIFAGGIEFSGDDGTNQLSFNGSNGLVSIGKLASGQSISYTGGGGGDGINSSQAMITMAGGIEFAGGNGGNQMTFDASGMIRLGTTSTGQSIKVTGGNDTDGFFFGGPLLRFKGSLEMAGDAGGNFIDLDGTSIKIGKTAAGVSVLLDGGAESDSIDFENNVKISGSITLNGGAGNNLLDLTGIDFLKVGGPVTFVGGADNDNFRIDASTLDLAQSVTFTGGAGTDDFSIMANGTIGGDVTADLGAATADSQDATFGSHYGKVAGLVLKGALALTAAGTAASTDTLVITNVSVAKALTASMGAGVSTVTIDNLRASDTFTLTTGDGADVVSIERGDFFGNSVITKLAMIQTGAGDDTLLIGSPTPAPNNGAADSTRVRFIGGLTADGGTAITTDSANDIAGQNDFPNAAPNVTGFEVSVP